MFIYISYIPNSLAHIYIYLPFYIKLILIPNVPESDTCSRHNSFSRNVVEPFGIIRIYG
ncbi:hypothetical protein F383_18122 [Gossypium arboreum]|uniref:Uncharacterized protein n=1 Tax=Gossypium arboreum TaxID=29729 RepID=A0A0B0MNE9_GOSAR|nr:hypothetical protein F383_18122 [Gossypium arboreum]